MVKYIGYFVGSGGRLDFVGGIGGPRETVPKREIYSRMVALLQLMETNSKPASRGLSKDKDLKERWVTMEKASKRGRTKINSTWMIHRDWWTLNEPEEQLIRMERMDQDQSKDKDQNEDQNKDTGSGEDIIINISQEEERRLLDGDIEMEEVIVSCKKDSVGNNEDRDEMRDEFDEEMVSIEKQVQEVRLAQEVEPIQCNKDSSEVDMDTAAAAIRVDGSDVKKSSGTQDGNGNSGQVEKNRDGSLHEEIKGQKNTRATGTKECLDKTRER